jgi:ammonium transporter Rh
MGLLIGLFRYLAEQGENNNTIQHEKYTADRSSTSFALMGTLIAWIFFPILCMDYSRIDAPHTPYTGPISVLFALCAATLASFLISSLFNDGVLVRDIIYGPIAGGVATSTASYWILNPAYALTTGTVAAIVQVVVMNLI